MELERPRKAYSEVASPVGGYTPSLSKEGMGGHGIRALTNTTEVGGRSDMPAEVARPDLPNGRDTHGAKVVFNGGATETEVLTGPAIPHVVEKPGFESTYHTEGKLGETGVLAYDPEGNILGAVRHPDWIVTDVEPKEGFIDVHFGGEPTEEHIEASMLRKLGPEGAATVAQELVDAAKESVHLPYHASTRGSEVESFLIQGDHVVAAHPDLQEELIAGIHEVALPPSDTLEEGMVARAQLVEQQYESDSEVKHLNTGVPLVGHVEATEDGTVIDSGLTINHGTQYESYVAGMSKKLREGMGRHTENGGQIGDFVAQKYGYDTFEELVAARPTVDYWANAAAHHSVSLPHVPTEHDGRVVPTEIAIGTSDMLATDMAKVSGLLTYSSPIMYGDMPEVDGKNPLDTRDLYRETMSTAHPGDLIHTPEELNARVSSAIKDGGTHTIDRAAYTTTVQGQDLITYHGPVRLRQAAPKTGDAPIGRVESTESGSTFSLADEYARNAFLDALKLGAFEAAAAGQHPTEYWGERYPSLAGNAERSQIGEGYNLNGPEDPTAGAAIEQAAAFVEEMAGRYTPFERNFRFAADRIRNLRMTATAQNLEEYEKDPIGPVSQVLQNMHRAGVPAEQIAASVVDFEYRTAKKILEANGDVPSLFEGQK